MALADRILNRVESLVGSNRSEELDALRESRVQFESYREDAEELARVALETIGGSRAWGGGFATNGHTVLAMRSRRAFAEDPIAGAEADHLANFAIGRGIAQPEMEDPEVQAVVDEAWTDSNNQQKLTSFEAQRHRSNQLVTDSNLYVVAFVAGGHVKLAFLDPDRVVEVIPDEDDDERPLFYAYRKAEKQRWDYVQDQPETQNPVENQKLTYYPHWKNVEDVQRERREAGEDDLVLPPADRYEDQAYVHHVSINRVGRALIGTPRWARSLRFMSAMNQILEAHVTMARAQSSIIAKRVVAGSQDAVVRAANNVFSQTGELGAGRLGLGGGTLEPGIGRLGGFGPAGALRNEAPAGATMVENPSDRLESVNLKSGAGEAQQTAQIVRAPLSASSGFSQAYLGDASNSNLATETSLDLPTSMRMNAWQQTLRELLSFFVEMVLQEAVRAGRIKPKGKRKPGEDAKPGEADPEVEFDDDQADGKEPGVLEYRKTWSELRLSESADLEAAESKLGVKLGFRIEMPFPGRRNLPDVTTAITGMLTALDPGGKNIPLRRAVLLLWAQHGWAIEDPVAWTDQALPEVVVDAVARGALKGQDSDAEGKAAADAAAAAVARGEDPAAAAAQAAVDAKATAAPPGAQGREPGDIPPNARGAVREDETLEALLDPLIRGIIAPRDDVDES